MNAAGPEHDQTGRPRSTLPPLTGSPEVTPGLAKLGTTILIVSLSVLFVASIIGYLWVRLRADEWPPAGSPPLPATLWISTLVLVASSVTMHMALRAVRRGQPQYPRWLLVTFSLGVLFLILQVWNWFQLSRQELTARTNLYGFTFYVLTGLHGLHVVGGLIPLGVVTHRARKGGWYSQEQHPGIEQCAMYWHFLDVVWMVLYAVFLVAS